VSDPASTSPGNTADAASSDALARPNHDVLETDATSRASGVSLAGGALHIGSVVASGASSTTGSKGGGKSRAAVTINDVSVGGTTFSISSVDSGDGAQKVELTSGGQTLPADSTPAKAVVAAANQGLKPVGCSMSVLSDPSRYPQGFVFARPDPEVGVRKDGTLAASYRGGLLLVCEVPDNPAAQATKFSPERFQVLVGFVYTSAAANPAAGGFGLGDLAGGVGRPLSLGSPGIGLAPAPGQPAGLAVPSGSPALGGTAAAGSSTPPPATAARPRPKPIAAVGPLGMGTGTRVLLGLVCVVAWGWLTHVGASRFRRATAPCPPGERT
jgi:hypothetical protein